MSNSNFPGDSSSGLEARPILNEPIYVTSIAWSPTGKLLAIATGRIISLCDSETGRVVSTLTGQRDLVHRIAYMVWAEDEKHLVSASSDGTILIWRVANGQIREMLQKGGASGYVGYAYLNVTSMAKPNNSSKVAVGSGDGSIKCWSIETRQLLWLNKAHSQAVHALQWSPNGKMLASAAEDGTIGIWVEHSTGISLRAFLRGHTAAVLSVAWSPDERTLASSSSDNTIRLWDVKTARCLSVLEGHSHSIYAVAFSPDGQLLASQSYDGDILLWRCSTWEPVTSLVSATGEGHAALAFHPHKPTLVIPQDDKGRIRILDLDVTILVNMNPMVGSVHYTNAKVVLVGDTGVGKSGLGLALTGQPFAPTESTHARRVWTFETESISVGEGRVETREVFLWDLAGQPGYRLIHQLHLNEVAVALLLFDARSETDPFAGVQYWNRALVQARRLQGNGAPALKKFLIAARMDRGGPSVSSIRITTTARELGFESYFETSAKEGWGIAELVKAIKSAIGWDTLPKVTSNKLFQSIKAFLIGEKEAGRVLSTGYDLYRAFIQSEASRSETVSLRAQFDTCIGLLQARDLIRRLSFGNLILLQPELLDAYASAIVNAAKEEPDGLGSIVEEDARMGRFRMPDDERVIDRNQESLLLIATVEDLLRREIALREHSAEGPMLVFPSQFTREWPDAPDPVGKAVTFDFEGPILSIYTTLVVRLSRSSLFARIEMWKNAVLFKASVAGTCGIWLREIEDGRAQLTLFYSHEASSETRFQFEDYIFTHLIRRALPDTIVRKAILICESCQTPITDVQIENRRQRGFDWINCNVCEERVSINNQQMETRANIRSVIPQIDRAAEQQRKRDTETAIMQGKIKTDDFDVFLCHNSKNKPQVREIANRLKDEGILPWLDEWQLRPGLPWQKLLEEQIEKIKSVAVFVGRDGIGPWQDMEQNAFLRQFVKRGCPVIPVILPRTKIAPKLPIFLESFTWVDFRRNNPDPFKKLIWGITGERSE